MSCCSFFTNTVIAESLNRVIISTPKKWSYRDGQPCKNLHWSDLIKGVRELFVGVAARKIRLIFKFQLEEVLAKPVALLAT